MRHGLWQRFLVLVLVAMVISPIDVWSAAPLGTARAARGVRASLDNGTTWLELKGSALPVFSGTEVRSAGGSATIELKDGSRIEVLPFSAVRFEATSVSLTYGRLSFRLHPQSKMQFVTPVARLEAAEQGTVAGEVFVTGRGVMGLKMAEGRLNVKPTTPGGQTMVASLEPVFLPKRPGGSGPLFASDGPMAPPAGAKAVFAPSGESAGYLDDGNLVIHPGFTSDLTQPFSPKLVRLAMASIQDQEQRNDAMPLFDVNGGYVGYLAGPVFYAQSSTQEAPASPAATQGGGGAAGGAGAPGAGKGPSISRAFAYGAGAVAVVGGGGLAAGGLGGGGGSKSPAATPFAPK